MFKLNRSMLVASLLVFFLGAFAFVVQATHSWSVYHWGRTSNPFTLKLGDNVSSNWDSYLGIASSDWSLSSVLDTVTVSGLAGKNCRPTSGRIEVCNKKYGNNGWLGIAQVWISDSHITQGVVKMNDTYFSTSTYNTAGWKSLVMCQEIGHVLGLDHQDEDFNNSPINPHTCMDYFTPDASEIVHPNQHDYDQLLAIYTHLDSTATLGSTVLPRGNGAEVNLDDPSAWGKSLRKDSEGNNSLFGIDLGNGEKLFTFVIWAN